jgi:precorrin-3B methylase
MLKVASISDIVNDPPMIRSRITESAEATLLIVRYLYSNHLKMQDSELYLLFQFKEKNAV